MALQKQNLSYKFVKGLDQKADSKLVTEGLLKLENGMFKKIGAISKRYGYDLMADTGSFEVGNGVSTFNNELVGFQDSRINTYSSLNGEMVDKGFAESLAVSITPIVRSNTSQSNVTVGYHEGLTVYAWNDDDGALRISAVDEETSAKYLHSYQISASGDTPKILGVLNYVYIFYCEGTSLKWNRLTLTNPSSVTAATEIKTNVHADHLFDAVVYNDAFVLTYKDSDSVPAIMYVNRYGSVGTPANGYAAETAIVDECSDVLALALNNQRFCVGYMHTDGLKSTVFDELFNYTATESLIDGTVSGSISPYEVYSLAIGTGATGSLLEGDENTFRLYYTLKHSSTPKYSYVKTNTISYEGAVGTASTLIKSVGLASKPFDYDTKPYINVLHESTLQPTVFTINQLGYIVARTAAANAGNIPTFLTQVNDLDNGQYLSCLQYKGSYRVEDTVGYTPLGLHKVLYNFQDLSTYTTQTTGGNLLITGGLPQIYDGVSVTEAGYNLYPEDLSVTVPASGSVSGSVDAGVHYYVAVYEWLDNSGTLHRSATSIPASGTVGAGENAVQITVPTLHLTNKKSPRDEIDIVIYGTVAAGEVYYKAATASNDTSVDTVTITVTVSDASLIANLPLYTTGGVLDNYPPPNSKYSCLIKNRMFLAGTDSTNKIIYSKKIVDGDGLAFNDDLYLNVDSAGGEITGLARLDEKLIIFKNGSTYLTVGDGPEDTGEGGSYTLPQVISDDIGCIEPNSIVNYPEGVFFKTAKGFYAVTRNLEFRAIGKAVMDYDYLTITSAQIVADLDEVRFTSLEGITLVYNYYFSQWSTNTGQTAIDATNWQNTFVYINSDGKILKENKTKFYEDQTPYRLKIGTAWMKGFTDVQGFQRVWRAVFLGDFKSAHVLKVKVFYDYKEFEEETYYFTPSSALGVTSTYGDDTPLGESVFGAVYDSVYQFSIHLSRQKCTAVRFEIEDLTDNSVPANTGESFSLTDMTLEIGVKGGTSRFGRNKRL